ncbi:30S ribosomal protein S14 [Candidatus Vidania fulgoroideorum]
MSKKSVLERNKKRKKLYIKFKNIRKKINKDIILNKFLLSTFPKNSSVTRIRNRCYITGRSRGYYRKFSISRSFLREKIMNGEISGVYKISW